jgi:hypothetical protein
MQTPKIKIEQLAVENQPIRNVVQIRNLKIKLLLWEPELYVARCEYNEEPHVQVVTW